MSVILNTVTSVLPKPPSEYSTLPVLPELPKRIWSSSVHSSRQYSISNQSMRTLSSSYSAPSRGTYTFMVLYPSSMGRPPTSNM